MNRRVEQEPMLSTEKQNEFFPELQITKAKISGHPLRKEMAFGRRITLNLSYENIVLLFIALIMLLVLFFSLGVERGKRITTTRAEPKKAEPIAPVAYEESSVMETIESGREKIIDSAQKPYTIQVSAFRKEEKAQKEIGRLKSEGYDAFIIPSGEWLQVCVGRYTNREESQKDFNILKENYPSCFLRRIEK